MKKISHYKFKRDILINPEAYGETKGNKTQWSSTYGPNAAFNLGYEREYPCHALKVGADGSSAAVTGQKQEPQKKLSRLRIKN